MHRTMFGEPRPKGEDELRQAIEEYGMESSDCDARVSYLEGEPLAIFNGWSAEVSGFVDDPDRDDDDSYAEFITAGHETKEELMSALAEVGVMEHRIEFE